MSWNNLLSFTLVIVKSICLCGGTRLWSLVLPKSLSTRLISSPWATLVNCKNIWQRALYEHILLSCCNFLFHIHMLLRRLAPHLRIRNSCCGVLGWNQGCEDEMMGKMCCYQPNHGGTGSGAGIVLAQRNILYLKDSVFYSILFCFCFFTLSRGFENWKWFLQTTGVFSFSLA